MQFKDYLSYSTTATTTESPSPSLKGRMFTEIDTNLDEALWAIVTMLALNLFYWAIKFLNEKGCLKCKPNQQFPNHQQTDQQLLRLVATQRDAIVTLTQAVERQERDIRVLQNKRCPDCG